MNMNVYIYEHTYGWGQFIFLAENLETAHLAFQTYVKDTNQWHFKEAYPCPCNEPEDNL